MSCLEGKRNILGKGVINIAHNSASEKWPLSYLRTNQHNKISQLAARIPQNDKDIPSLIIYSVLTQVT